MDTVLITGASGHLGRNLVKTMLENGFKVRIVVRDAAKAEKLNLCFDDSLCEVILGDLTSLQIAYDAAIGSDFVFQVAANFNHWSLSPQSEIVETNVNITKNILEASRKYNIQKIVYVSSIGVLKRGKGEVIKSEDWSTESYGNPYFESKLKSEKVAWDMAKKFGIDMTSVLPSALLGGSFEYSTPTSNFLLSLKHGKIPFDLNCELNFVDVEDVCDAMLAAINSGRNGGRYILANPQGIPLSHINRFYQKNSNQKLRRLIKVNKIFLQGVATFSELIAKITRKEPLLLKSQVDFYYGTKEVFDISESVRDLGFSPKSNLACLETTLL